MKMKVTNNTTYNIGTYHGIYGDDYPINMAHDTMFPKHIAGYKFISFPEFEALMKRWGYKKHHTSSIMQCYQSKKYNLAEHYEGRYGRGYRIWSHAPQNRGSAFCTYYIFDRKYFEKNMGWITDDTDEMI